LELTFYSPFNTPINTPVKQAQAQAHDKYASFLCLILNPD